MGAYSREFRSRPRTRTNTRLFDTKATAGVGSVRACVAHGSNHKGAGKAGAKDTAVRWVDFGCWVGRFSFSGAPPRGEGGAPLGLAVLGAELGRKALAPK